MTLCPYAVVAGCKRCPIFSICPLKTVIGDHVPAAEKPTASASPKEEPAGAGKPRGRRKPKG